MRTTVSLPDDLSEYVDENFASDDISDAQAVRDAIEHARTLEKEIVTLESRIAEQDAELDELETELERVKNEKRLILKDREETTELVRAVEGEQAIEAERRDAEERRTRLEERKARASVFQRAKWWFTGMDAEEDDQ